MARRCDFRALSIAGLLPIAVLLCGLPPPPAAAQTQAINGAIRGRVTDPSAALVPDAAITVANQDTGFSRSLATGGDGSYVFPNLPLGTYTVSIAKPGFRAERRPGVTLSAGQEAVVDSQLVVGDMTPEIVVAGGSEVIEPTRIDTGRTIGHQETDNLPLTSRNPYNFLIFQPGVSGHPNAELSTPKTVNTNGLLDRINYQLDGAVDTESDVYGVRLIPISNTSVREVQTVSNSYAPEFGGTAGDIFNVITNSGTNELHGESYYIGRPAGASARPILLAPAAAKPDLTLRDFSESAGGPVIKDKLFFFGGYEHLDRGLPLADTISPADAALIGLAPSLLAVAPTAQHVQFVNFRQDWALSGRNQVFLRYNYYRNDFPFWGGVGGVNALDASADLHDRSHALGAQALTAFSPATLNELRFGWPYRNKLHVPGALTGPGPQIAISGVATFHGSSAAGSRFQEKIPNLNDAVTAVRGKHTLKAGAGFQQILDTQTDYSYTQYVFPSVTAYLRAKSGADPFAYTSYNSIVGLPGAWYRSFFWNWFAQDSWQVHPRLLASFGIRYDRFQSPDADPNAAFVYSRQFRNPGRNFAPRLGLAWSITPKTVLRASSGLFFEPSPTNLWYNVFSSSNPMAYQASIPSTSALAPAFPTVSTFQAGTAPRSSQDIVAVTPNYKNAYTINTSLQVTRGLTNNDSLTVGYVNTGARDLEFLRNMNLINSIGLLADGRPIFSTTPSAATRLFPQYNNITLQDVGATASYNALVVHYLHRFSQGLLVDGSYTWSHSISDAPDANGYEQDNVISDPTNRARDLGNSSVNRPDAFAVSSVIEPKVALRNRVANWLANNNRLALLVNLSSGDQQNIVANRLLNGDAKAGTGSTSGSGASTAATRPLFIGRNTVRGPNVYQVDARYTRTFFTLWEHLRPSFVAEANNIFNHPNITALNTMVSVDSTGAAQLPAQFPALSTVLEGRILQFGVRLDW
jgi:hypothetical protein